MHKRYKFAFLVPVTRAGIENVGPGLTGLGLMIWKSQVTLLGLPSPKQIRRTPLPVSENKKYRKMYELTCHVLLFSSMYTILVPIM